MLDAYESEIQTLIAESAKPGEVRDWHAEDDDPERFISYPAHSMIRLADISVEIRRKLWNNQQLAMNIAQAADAAGYEIAKKHDLCWLGRQPA